MDGAQGELSSAIHHSYIFTMKGVNPYIYLVSPNIQEYVFSNYYPTSVPELWSLLPRQALFDRHRRRSSKSSCNRALLPSTPFHLQEDRPDGLNKKDTT